MSLFFIWFNVVLLGIVLFYHKKYGLLAQPSIHFLLLNMVSVFVCHYAIHIEGIRESTKETEFFYVGIYLCSLFSVVKFSKKTKIKKEGIIEFLKKGSVLKYIGFGAVLNFLVLIYFLLQLKKDVIVLNYQYLRMVNVRALGIHKSILLVIYQKLLVMNGFFSFFAFGFLNNIRSKSLLIPKILYFIIGLFAFTYQLGNNSRSAGLILLGLLVSFILFEKKSLSRLVKIGLVLLCVGLSYKSAIYGRGQMRQGISQIDKNITNSFKSKSVELIFAGKNIFGGATVFNRAKDLNDRYPTGYKVLSFSPFPSAIDNYTKYHKFENRINVYEPYSANVEVYHFGGIYIVIYFTILILGLRVVNRAVSFDKIIGVLLAFPSYLFFITYQQYTLRSCFRFFLYSVIFCFLFISYKKKKMKKKDKMKEVIM